MSAGLASGRAASCLSAEDYDLCGDIGEEELIAIAVEQSLERHPAGTESPSTRMEEWGGLRERAPLADSHPGSTDCALARRLHCGQVERSVDRHVFFYLTETLKRKTFLVFFLHVFL